CRPRRSEWEDQTRHVEDMPDRRPEARHWSTRAPPGCHPHTIERVVANDHRHTNGCHDTDWEMDQRRQHDHAPADGPDDLEEGRNHRVSKLNMMITRSTVSSRKISHNPRVMRNRESSTFGFPRIRWK